MIAETLRFSLKLVNKPYRKHINNQARTQIFYGGSSSGKSFFLAQRCVLDIARGGRNYLVCRQVGRTIQRSVFNEIVKAINRFGWTSLFTINKTDYIITHVNGYQILFCGLDDIEKVKSITPSKGVLTDIWIEEATECEYATIKQLYKRQRGGDPRFRKRMILSFNPIMQTHWIFNEYFIPAKWHDGMTEFWSDRLTILKTWYIHNQWLTQEDIYDLESETDTYFREVYTFGNWGVLGSIIFTNWTVQDLSTQLDQMVNHRHGLDFGFSSDPAAMPCTHYDRKIKTIYIYNELYEKKLTNNILALEIVDRIGKDYVRCDSAEPKSIAELQQHGVSAVPAKKGKDSVLFGIQWLQQQKVIIDPKCINTINEFRVYKWKEDKNGIAMREPVDRFNHIIDGLRYAYEDESLGGDWNVY